ncbi:hypothetical protein [Microbacterium endophyticum]|uniref:hypothetical protein n=1 Tax=Microbacterium endophyticum TaxID=1526412 RepID=UPI0019D0AA8F|nr:hypothetical protein [Microbacterium endophyticum]
MPTIIPLKMPTSDLPDHVLMGSHHVLRQLKIAVVRNGAMDANESIGDVGRIEMISCVPLALSRRAY